VDGDDAGKQLFPDAEWFALWQTGALARFLPKRGQRGDPAPVLEVHHHDKDGARAIGLMLLAIEGWNDIQVRRQVLQNIGIKWATEGWQVLALVFASCAWARAFTPAERAARGNRLVETYDDKREVMMVQGSTLDNRMACAQAEILRDKVGRVRATTPWDVRHQGQMWHLDFATLDVAWEAYVRTVHAMQGGMPDLSEVHC